MANDQQFTWCNNILTRGLKDIQREFIANKMVQPETYTTVAYGANYSKNRYDDIPCIDATRVILKDRPAEDNYIHANWMTMPDEGKYIVTQGPMKSTLNDFWHMIVEETSNVVVTLTHPEDSGENFAHYFPIEKTEEKARYKVSIKEEKDDPFPGIRHRILEVTGGSRPWIVQNIVYDGWRRLTAPNSTAQTVFLHKMSKILAAGGVITIVSSAGIGRAGTFVGIDYIQQKLRIDDFNDTVFNMVDTMKELRGQRFHAIQSLHQYFFLHLCLLEMSIEERVVPRDGRYEKLLSMYQRHLKKFYKKYQIKE